jgi:hypothetical protein
VTDTTHMTEAELADYYADTPDLSEFHSGEVVPVPRGRRDMVLSVRFCRRSWTRCGCVLRNRA